jgi:hypothetical protein
LRLTGETPLDLFDSGLQRRDVLLQLREGPFENLTPAALVGESRFDPPKSLRDRRLLLLQPLESPVDLVEVGEDVVSEFDQLPVHLGEPPIHLAKSPVDLGGLLSK